MDARFFPLRDGSSEPFYLRESAPLFRKAAEKSQVPPRTHSHSRILIQGFGDKGSGHKNVWGLPTAIRAMLFRMYGQSL